jgi:hypothetical protein
MCSWLYPSRAVGTLEAPSGVGIELPEVVAAIIVHLDGAVLIVPFKDPALVIYPSPAPPFWFRTLGIGESWQLLGRWDVSHSRRVPLLALRVNRYTRNWLATN